MKIIDLLNKIANGEEVPKKIKLRTFELKRTQSIDVHRLYVDNEVMFFPKDYSFRLDDEVEILEEEKKIPEKLENEHEFYSYAKYEENKNEIDKVLYILKAINLVEEKIGNLNNSINEVIDYLDYLKSKGDE